MPSAHRRKLPIGIQTFSIFGRAAITTLIKRRLLKSWRTRTNTTFSRPRRFGKSLLLDTLGCLFEGREALFEGLYIYDKWSWQQRQPVVRLSFGNGVATDREGLKNLYSVLKDARSPPALCAADRRFQVQQSQPAFRAEQPARHHTLIQLCRYLWLYRP